MVDQSHSSVSRLVTLSDQKNVRTFSEFMAFLCYQMLWWRTARPRKWPRPSAAHPAELVSEISLSCFLLFFFFISFYIYNFYLILTSLYMFFFNGVVTKLVACASNDRIAVTLINLVLVAAALLLVFAGAASPVEETGVWHRHLFEGACFGRGASHKSAEAPSARRYAVFGQRCFTTATAGSDSPAAPLGSPRASFSHPRFRCSQHGSLFTIKSLLFFFFLPPSDTFVVWHICCRTLGRLRSPVINLFCRSGCSASLPSSSYSRLPTALLPSLTSHARQRNPPTLFPPHMAHLFRAYALSHTLSSRLRWEGRISDWYVM